MLTVGRPNGRRWLSQVVWSGVTAGEASGRLVAGSVVITRRQLNALHLRLTGFASARLKSPFTDQHHHAAAAAAAVNTLMMMRTWLVQLRIPANRKNDSLSSAQIP